MVAIAKRVVKDVDDMRSIRSQWLQGDDVFEGNTDEYDEEGNDEEASSDASVDNAIRQYLAEIGRFPLLNSEQELSLAWRVVQGDMEAQRRLVENLEERGIDVYRSFVGNYYTALEMAGFSIALMGLDEEMKGLIDAPASSAHFHTNGLL